MRQSLDDLIQLLKDQQSKTDDFQKLQIAVSYFSFRSRNIELKEHNLQQLKQMREHVEETIDRIKADPEEWERFDASARTYSSAQSPDDPTPSERRIKRLQEKVDSLDNEIITLELVVQELNSDLEAYEAFVQKKLDLYN